MGSQLLPLDFLSPSVPSYAVHLFQTGRNIIHIILDTITPGLCHRQRQTII